MSDASMESVIAIDFGTMYSRVAVYENDKVTVIPDEYGNHQIPSCVAFNDNNDEILFGHDAIKASENKSDCAVFGVKQLMGRTFGNLFFDEVCRFYALSVIEENSRPTIQTKCKEEMTNWAPEEIAALLLLKLKEMAEQYLGKTVKKAIITVPAIFCQAQRNAIMDAAEIAKLEVLRLLNNTEATSITYIFKKAENMDKECNAVFVDCGCKCFQLSHLSMSKTAAEIKYHNYCFYGGDEITKCLFDYCAEMFKKANGDKDICDIPQAKHRLRMACEKAKHCLFTDAETVIEVENILNEITFRTTVTREQFEEISKSVLDEYSNQIKYLKRYLKENKIYVDEMVLLGGSSRILKLRQMISDAFGGKTQISTNIIDDDTAVVFGAAVKTYYLSQRKKSNLLVSDVAMWPLSIKSSNGYLPKTIIAKGTPLPHSATFLLSELREESCEGAVDIDKKSLTVNYGESLKLDLSNVLQKQSNVSEIEIVFCLNVCDVLNVSTKTKGSNETTPVNIKNMRNLNKSDVIRMAQKCSTLFEKGKNKEKVIKMNARLKMLLENTVNSFDAQQIEITQLRDDVEHLSADINQMQCKLQNKGENNNVQIRFIAEQSVIAYKERRQRESNSTEESNVRCQLHLICQTHLQQAMDQQRKRQHVERQETAERKIWEEVIMQKNHRIHEMAKENLKIMQQSLLQLQAIKLREYEKQKKEINLLQSIAAKDQLKIYAYEMLVNISDNQMADKLDASTIQQIKNAIESTLHWLQASSKATQENCQMRLFELQNICTAVEAPTPSNTESSEEWSELTPYRAVQ